jgi:pyruvate dehydrogenase E2 component (dihydrolipoamide acetyltransferase)
MARMADFRLPDVGEGLTEGEILTWYVSVGDLVAVNQTIVEVETAKAAVELPSPYAGRVAALHVAAGQTVDVGTTLITIDTDPGEPDVDATAAPSASTDPGSQPLAEFVPAAAGPLREAVLVGYGVREASVHRRPRRAAGGSARPVQPTRHGGLEVGRATEAAAAGQAATAKAKPPVRKLAKDLGIDLAEVTATGPAGTVSRDDVLAAQQRGAPLARPSGEPVLVGTVAEVEPHALVFVDGERREPVKGVRKAMAEAMVRSAFSAPHVTEWVEVDVTRSVKLVRRLRDTPGFSSARVSPLLLVARATLLGLRRTPDLNAMFDGANQEVVYRDHVNLGIAAATPRGLLVPNVKDAHRLSLPELAHALDALVRTARDGRTSPAELAGGTFTITNVGVFGVDGGTPIINPGEGAILCVGAFRERAWVHKGKVKPRVVAQLTVSFDHRHIDGALGSRFLADVAAVLEDPAAALGWA